MLEDFMPVLPDPIPEINPFQKCHMDTSLVLEQLQSHWDLKCSISLIYTEQQKVTSNNCFSANVVSMVASWSDHTSSRNVWQVTTLDFLRLN